MRGTKKVCAIAAVCAMLLNNVYIKAEEKAVSITDFQLKDGVVSVEAANNTDAKTILTLVLKKTDGEISDKQRLYAVLDNETDKGKTAVFEIKIPDERDGVRGSGSYTLKIQNQAKEYDEKSFEYADSNDINAFIELLKTEDLKVSDAEKAYEYLLPVINAPENRGEISTIGLDFEQFSGKSSAVQQMAMNAFHNNGISSLNKETLPDAFLSAFGLAVFNSGEKSEGLEILSPKYNGKEADADILSGAVGYMENSYSGISQFTQGFKTAYGLETVNLATMNNIDSVLETFARETSSCSSAIANVRGISDSLKKRSAFEYIILELSKSKATEAAKLQEILEAAYRKATSGAEGGGSSSGGGGGSSSGGGGSFGSVSNSVGTNYGSVTSPAGIETPDKKAESTNVFTDLNANHWSAPAVLWLKNRGIVNGNEKGGFEPDRAVTREEFTKMLVLVCKISTESGVTEFSDVNSGEWYAPYVAAAAKGGIINGISENSFGVGEKISRQDMAVMVQRAVSAKNITLKAVKAYKEFEDKNKISDYAADAIKALYEAGVINGKSEKTFDPSGSATRAEAAKIIFEAFKGV